VVEGDDNFYWRSGGVITVGGGDPVYQAEFVHQLLRRCQERGINTAIETAGHSNFINLEKICQYANQIYFDIKHIDPLKHKNFTGVTNNLILENFKKITETFPYTPITVRTPIVPGFNDFKEVIESIASFLGSAKNLKEYELLPYHGLGESKYEKLGNTYSLKALKPPSKDYLSLLQSIADRCKKV